MNHLYSPKTEVRDLLKQADKRVPVMALEWGEELCKTLPVSFLKDGVPLKS